MATVSAPITSVMLTVQFAPPAPPFNPVQLAYAHAALRAKLPMFEQTGRAGPMPIDPMTPEPMPALLTPRNIFRDHESEHLLFFQEDRFSYMWVRRGGLNTDAEYPGFAHIFERAADLWTTLKAAIFATQPPVALTGEIIYQNNFDVPPAVSLNDLADVYSVVDHHESHKVNVYNINWVEPLADPGFLDVRINGPSPSPQGTPTTHLQMMGRFRISDSWDGVAIGFDKMHAVMDAAFKRVVRPAHRPI